MNATERRAVSTLASIFALRMLGLFLLLPVLVIHAEGLGGHTAILAGLALGIYGLSQAFLQLPFGYLSDRFGRKPVITLGLLIFALGSLIAALADDIFWLIVGRALQGGGAIAAVVLALIADLTREQQRTKAMAIIGVSIGLVFMLSLVLGPILSEHIGVNGLFWLTALLTLLAILVLWGLVPDPAPDRATRQRQTLRELLNVLKNPRLLQLDAGIFALHAILTAIFVVIPVTLSRQGGLELGEHWKVYIPVLLGSLLIMGPLMAWSSRNHSIKPSFVISLLLLLASQAMLAVGGSTLGGLIAGLWLFFSGFNTLEALLPSLVSRIAPAHAKGAAMGMYTSAEFLGVFFGGVMGGWLYGSWGWLAVFLFCGILALLWLIWQCLTPAPQLFETVMVEPSEAYREDLQALREGLKNLPGVVNVTIIAEADVAYLDIRPEQFIESSLDPFRQTD